MVNVLQQLPIDRRGAGHEASKTLAFADTMATASNNNTLGNNY